MRLSLLVFAMERRFNPIVKSEEKRILIIVIGGLGDCLLFDSLFRRLKERWPRARIEVLTGQCFEDMWENLDSVDNLIYVPFPDEGRPPWAYAAFLRTIYRHAYDIVARHRATGFLVASLQVTRCRTCCQERSLFVLCPSDARSLKSSRPRALCFSSRVYITPYRT